MLVIGLTGGIASGKTVVSAMFTQLGAHVIDVDKIARQIVVPHKPAWNEIVEHFGRHILLPDESINRKLLGQIVFNDSDERAVLEDITHPRIEERVLAELKKSASAGRDIVVVDAPLLIEAGWCDLVDKVWLVYVDEKTQLTRLMQRNGLSREEALKRIRAQMSFEQKIKYADFIIDNNGDVAHTEKQVMNHWRQMKKPGANI